MLVSAGQRMRATVSPPPTGPTGGGLRHAQKAADAARQRPAGVCHQKAHRNFTQRAKFTPHSAPAGASSLNLSTGGLVHHCIALG